jgi:endoglycosylceramidase
MFQRVRDAIRTVDTNHILFLETSMSANMGIPSGVARVVDAHGRPDALQALAPHGYDIVVDTRDLALASNERLEFIFQRHSITGKRLALPVLIGEWGAYGAAGPEVLPTARFHAALFEKYLFSDTFWAYDQSLKSAGYLEALQRPIPVRVNGTLLACQTDFERGKFTCSWNEDPAVAVPTKIYLPRRIFASREAVQLRPFGGGFTVEPIAGNTGHVHLVIAPAGAPSRRTLTVN